MWSTPPQDQPQITVLIVEDDEIVRESLSTLIEHLRFSCRAACNGAEAMEMLELYPFDLVLLDLAMPDVDGYQVLQRIKSDLAMRQVPVIVLSGLSDVDVIIRCVELGADDYLIKPVNFTLLKARIFKSLEHKKLYDVERNFLRRLEAEQERSERLLLNVLPASIAQRLKAGECGIAEHFPASTVLFSDLVGFSRHAMTISPAELVSMLNNIFSAFDELADRFRLEKIKTIGDAYMLVGGVPNPRSDHAEAVADMALAMREALKTVNTTHGYAMRMRIGINSGPVVAGIIGTRKFSYDLWGETVNIASRMESLGRPGWIQVGAGTYELLKDTFFFEPASVVDAKGMGQMDSYLLLGRRE
jgi:adenylate cyclase